MASFRQPTVGSNLSGSCTLHLRQTISRSRKVERDDDGSEQRNLLIIGMSIALTLVIHVSLSEMRGKRQSYTHRRSEHRISLPHKRLNQPRLMNCDAKSDHPTAH